jgi:carbon storage regulator CsrA
MLLLSRFPNQDIIIEVPKSDGTIDLILVRVLEINKNVVRLGFDTGKHIRIWRSEVYAKIHSKKHESDKT